MAIPTGKITSRSLLALVLLLSITAGAALTPVEAGERLYSLNLYTGRMTSNHWEDFFIHNSRLSFNDSYLIAASLARRVGKYGNKASFEVEGQVVKHFDTQKHWEINALVTTRWESFWWDRFLDTSVAFGVGPSYAFDEPEIEIKNDGDKSRFLIYWMMELAAGLPDYPDVAFIVRLHHRSDAFGLVAEEGGSNALAFGLKYRF